MHFLANSSGGKNFPHKLKEFTQYTDVSTYQASSKIKLKK